MLTVGAIIGGAFRLVRERPLAVAVWGLFYLALTLVMAVAMRPFAGAAATMSADPQVAAVQMMSAFRWLFLIELLMLACLIALFNASQRAVLRPQDQGFFYLRLGMDELRMFGLAILLIILLYIIMIVAVLVMALIGGFLAVAGAPVAAVSLVIVFMFVWFGAMIWLEVRLSLTFPLTLLRRKIIIGESWRLTRGRFWTLFGAYLVLFLILIVLFAPVMALTIGPYWAAMAGNLGDPQRAQAVQVQMMQNFGALTPANLAAWIAAALVGAIGIALIGGALGTVTRILTHGDEDPLAETFA